MKNKHWICHIIVMLSAGLLFSGCETGGVSTSAWRNYTSKGYEAWNRGDLYAADTNYSLALAEIDRSTANGSGLITTLESLAQVRTGLRQYADAEALLQRRLEVGQALGWTNTLEYVFALQRLSDAQVSQKKYSEAEQAILKAESVLEYKFDRMTPLFGLLIAKRANIYALQNRTAAADSLFKDAKTELETLERSLQPTSAQHGWVQGSMGDFLDDYGKFKISLKQYADAEKLLRRSLSYMESQYSSDSGNLVYPLNHLSVACAGQAKFSDAEQAVRRSLSILNKKRITEHPAYAQAQHILAAVLDHKSPEL